MAKVIFISIAILYSFQGITKEINRCETPIIPTNAEALLHSDFSWLKLDKKNIKHLQKVSKKNVASISKNQKNTSQTSIKTKQNPSSNSVNIDPTHVAENANRDKQQVDLLGPYFVARRCQTYPGGLPSLAAHVKEALVTTLQCLDTLSPQRHEDALKLIALIQKNQPLSFLSALTSTSDKKGNSRKSGSSSIVLKNASKNEMIANLNQAENALQIECRTGEKGDTLSSDDLLDLGNDAVGRAFLCNEDGTPSHYLAPGLAIDVSRLVAQQEREGELSSKMILAHEMLHLLGYLHFSGMEVVYLAEWCCFEQDKELKDKACALLRAEDHISRSDYMYQYSLLLQRSERFFYGMETAWRNFLMYREQKTIEISGLIRSLIEFAEFTPEAAIEKEKQRRRKRIEVLLGNDKEALAFQLKRIDAFTVTMGYPYDVLLFAYAGLELAPVTKEKKTLGKQLEERVVKKFYPKKQTTSLLKLQFAQKLGHLLATLVKGEKNLSQSLKQAKDQALKTCVVLSDDEKDQVHRFFRILAPDILRLSVNQLLKNSEQNQTEENRNQKSEKQTKEESWIDEFVALSKACKEATHPANSLAILK